MKYVFYRENLSTGKKDTLFFEPGHPDWERFTYAKTPDNVLLTAVNHWNLTNSQFKYTTEFEEITDVG